MENQSTADAGLMSDAHGDASGQRPSLFPQHGELETQLEMFVDELDDDGAELTDIFPSGVHHQIILAELPLSLGSDWLSVSHEYVF